MAEDSARESTLDRRLVTGLVGEKANDPRPGSCYSNPFAQGTAPLGSRPTMIEALKSDHIVEKLGGRFKLTALIQRRLGEIIEGARPLVDRNGRSDLEVVIDEIMQDKITLEIDPEHIEKMRGTPSKKR